MQRWNDLLRLLGEYLMPLLDPNPVSDAIDPSTHVADLVIEDPRYAAVFERVGIGYCCGGKIPLTQACDEAHLNLNDVTLMLIESTNGPDEFDDWVTGSIDELIDDISNHHHRYVREHLPRLVMLSQKVAGRHGNDDPRLISARDIVARLEAAMMPHISFEDDTVFPACRAISAGNSNLAANIDALIHTLSGDHAEVTRELSQLRIQLDDYTIPENACTSYRAYLDTARRFEHDTYRHIYKENQILFGKVADALADLRTAG